MDLYFQKWRDCRKKEDKYVMINVPISEAQRRWNICRFIAHIIAENIDELSLVWRRSFKIDGEETIAKRLCIYYHKKGALIPVFDDRNVEDVIQTLQDGKWQVQISLHFKDYRLHDPALHPISPIKKKKIK